METTKRHVTRVISKPSWSPQQEHENFKWPLDVCFNAPRPASVAVVARAPVLRYRDQDERSLQLAIHAALLQWTASLSKQ
jgi:hypothetical protein